MNDLTTTVWVIVLQAVASSPNCGALQDYPCFFTPYPQIEYKNLDDCKAKGLDDLQKYLAEKWQHRLDNKDYYWGCAYKHEQSSQSHLKYSPQWERPTDGH